MKTKKITEAQFRKNSAERRKQLAQRLQQARIDIGLTQEALATTAGVDRKTINRIENEHFSPSVDTFFRLCQVLHIKPEALLGGK